MHIKLTNGVPAQYNPEQIRRENPGTSFPAVLADTTLAEFDVYPCQETTQPAYDYTKNVVETFEQVSGQWKQVWVVAGASAEEIAERTNNQAYDIRAERNQKLAASDWTQVADSPVDKPAWATYRQALRDISDQAGFPWEVVWPQEP